MDIARRIRELREDKEMSQGDIEHKTGLLRCYISRVENGHTIPAIETLEKIARSLEVPLYVLLYEGKDAPKEVTEDGVNDWASIGRGARQFRKFRQAIAAMSADDRKTLMFMAEKIARGRKKKLASGRAT
jgi:transcriptional regulator with XRE-family HTH domain